MPFYIFDTETTGLMDFKRPADADGQPRVASFAGLALEHPDDEPEVFERYVRPDGWAMSPDASRVNGLTNEFLYERGVPVAEVLDEYVRRIEDGYVVVAYNAQFDIKMMRAELRRAVRDEGGDVKRAHADQLDPGILGAKAQGATVLVAERRLGHDPGACEQR